MLLLLLLLLLSLWVSSTRLHNYMLFGTHLDQVIHKHATPSRPIKESFLDVTLSNALAGATHERGKFAETMQLDMHTTDKNDGNPVLCSTLPVDVITICCTWRYMLRNDDANRIRDDFVGHLLERTRNFKNMYSRWIL
jgi:hypothetical protein